MTGVTSLFLRLALGTAFLSAVSSRLGIWPEGMGGGSWEAFLRYTAELNPWATASLIPYLGWSATAAELSLGILLVIGFKQKFAGIASGILLMIFAASMMIGAGIKSPFDYSVFTASAASFMLASVGTSIWSVDAIISEKTLNQAKV